jgi:hypothetical protein
MRAERRSGSVRSRKVTALLLASALFLVIVAAVFLIPEYGPTMTVSELNLVGPTACGIISQSDPGFSLAPGGSEQFSAHVVPDRGECVVDAVTSETPGFVVLRSNTPLWVTSQPAVLTWVVQAPLSYQGNLTLNFTGIPLPTSPTPSNNSSCPSPCISSHIPGELYFLSYGEVLPAGWLVVEAGSIGAVVVAATLTSVRRR